MGVYQKYKDKDGGLCGPWFVKYPHLRDRKAGKIIYKIQRASNSRKLAEAFFGKKQDEFFKKDELGLAIEEPKPQISFDELIDWYLSQELVKAKKSYKSDLQWAIVLKNRFGRMIADDITKKQVRDYQVRRRAEKTWRGDFVKPSTVNREIALMRAAYNLAMDDGLVSENPCRKIRMLKESNARDRILSWQEFERLCSELSPVAQRIIMTAYHTGMRKAEILRLTINKVNFEERYIDLDGDDTKDHERRRVYFGEELCRVLRKCFELRERASVKHLYVFVRDNGQPVKCIRTAFENACKRAKLTDFNFHDLRGTATIPR